MVSRKVTPHPESPDLLVLKLAFPWLLREPELVALRGEEAFSATYPETMTFNNDLHYRSTKIAGIS